jgi:1-acyl-sn-glycerol-3-phosphate acyltransferase
VKILQQIGGRIWAVWGILLFVSTMFIALIFYIPCFIIKEPFASRWHRAVSRVWMSFYLTLIGCPLKIKNKENFIKGKNYIVVCNHNSLIDIPVTTPFMPQANKTIAKKSFAKIPFFGWIYAAGSVLVDRKNEKNRRKSYDDMKKVLKAGVDMVIYPEGTRNRSSEPLKSFYDGAFRLAVDTEKDILPALLFNTKKVLPVHQTFFLAPHTLELHFLPAVSPKGLSVNELKEKVFKMMWDHYASNE